MLAEIQEANKAFGVIKNALQNGRELYDVSGSCATYFNCKSIIARRSNKRSKKKTQKQKDNLHTRVAHLTQLTQPGFGPRST